jgi:5-methylcytosine-specific restriction endonuclease McrA
MEIADTKNVGKVKVRVLAVCLDCGNSADVVEYREWSHAARPRCSQCGGMLEQQKRAVLKPSYDPDFTPKRKQAVRRRDGLRCTLCGKTQKAELKESGRSLSNHHLDGNPANSVIDNLITLCAKCHSARVHKSGQGLLPEWKVRKMALLQKAILTVELSSDSPEAAHLAACAGNFF